MNLSRRLAAAGLACLMLSCGAAAVAADGPPPIQGSANLLLRHGASSTLSIDIVNPRPESLHVRWIVQLADADDHPITLPGGAEKAFDAGHGFSHARAPLDVPHAALPLHGFVALESGDTEKATLAIVPLKIETAGIEASGAWLFFSAGLMSTVLVAGAWLWSRRGLLKISSLRNGMGQPAWDLDKSFASNVTFLGSIVGVVLATTVLPDQLVLASRKTYISLNIVFSALIGLAPFVFTAIASVRRAATAGAAPGGFVCTFLVSAALTGWGALGQVTMLMALFFELRATASIAVPIALCFELVLGLVLIELLLYVPTTTFAILQGQRPVVSAPRMRAISDAIAADRVAVASARPDWLVL